MRLFIRKNLQLFIDEVLAASDEAPQEYEPEYVVRLLGIMERTGDARRTLTRAGRLKWTATRRLRDCQNDLRRDALDDIEQLREAVL